MQLRDDERELLRRNEESLWREQTRFDRRHMERLLADDFLELGRSGRSYSRDQCLDAPARQIHATLPLERFEVRPLAADTVLVTYVSEVRVPRPERANRASIWSRTTDGWKLRFHQGTPTD